MRTVRLSSKDIILDLLKKSSTNIDTILAAVKTKNKKLCDDNIKCECGKSNRSAPEWRHQVRWALQDLKYTGKISFKKETREFSLN